MQDLYAYLEAMQEAKSYKTTTQKKQKSMFSSDDDDENLVLDSIVNNPLRLLEDFNVTFQRLMA